MIGLVYGIFFCGFFSSHGYICFAILHSTICFRLAGKVETAYSDLLEQFCIIGTYAAAYHYIYLLPIFGLQFLYVLYSAQSFVGSAGGKHSCTTASIALKMSCVMSIALWKHTSMLPALSTSCFVLSLSTSP